MDGIRRSQKPISIADQALRAPSEYATGYPTHSLELRSQWTSHHAAGHRSHVWQALRAPSEYATGYPTHSLELRSQWTSHHAAGHRSHVWQALRGPSES